MNSVLDPVAEFNDKMSATVSKHSFVIAGIIVEVYGLDEVSSKMKEVTCLWLLHARMSQKEKMEPLVAVMLDAWTGQAGQHKRGLIAASFDQRNHGSRLVDERANGAWNAGNQRHAQDMFSIFQGTAADVSQLVTYLPAYVFPREQHHLVSNFVLGVSLGGHAAWHCVLQDPRITTAVVVIGCADYVRLMSQRAKKSRLGSWTRTDPPGKEFLGSDDFPGSLIESVNLYDPTALLMNKLVRGSDSDTLWAFDTPNDKMQTQLMGIHLHGKKILNIAGGSDKLVPYSCSELFFQWLEHAVAPGGWAADMEFKFENKIYEGAGHEMNSEMVKDAVAFVVKNMIEESSNNKSKI